MERYAWKALLKDGMKEEYIRRHNEIWPEMVQLLKEAGIENYSIWLCGNELFGYYECSKGIEYAGKTQANSPIVDKWNEYMKNVKDMPIDERTGAQPLLEEVFYLRILADETLLSLLKPGEKQYLSNKHPYLS